MQNFNFYPVKSPRCSEPMFDKHKYQPHMRKLKFSMVAGWCMPTTKSSTMSQPFHLGPVVIEMGLWQFACVNYSIWRA